MVTCRSELKARTFLDGRAVPYLSWVTVDDPKSIVMFRRAKLSLDGIPAVVIKTAVALGVLVGRLGLTDRNGHPLCAAVRPPLIEWSAVVTKR
jgi:hypothetical protein